MEPEFSLPLSQECHWCTGHLLSQLREQKKNPEPVVKLIV